MNTGNVSNNKIWLYYTFGAYIITIASILYNKSSENNISDIVLLPSILFSLFLLSLWKNKFKRFFTYIVITYVFLLFLVLLPNPFNTINDGTIYNIKQSTISILMNCITIIFIFLANHNR